MTPDENLPGDLQALRQGSRYLPLADRPPVQYNLDIDIDRAAAEYKWLYRVDPTVLMLTPEQWSDLRTSPGAPYMEPVPLGDPSPHWRGMRVVILTRTWGIETPAVSAPLLVKRWVYRPEEARW